MMTNRYMYRGKNPNTDCFVYGNLLTPTGADRVQAMIMVSAHDAETDAYVETSYVVDPSTVGQCTSLADINDRYIYEGDILKVSEDDGECVGLFLVKYGECGGIPSAHTSSIGFVGFYLEALDSNELRQDPLYWLGAYSCVVIGNIHDNPKLAGCAL